jgi:dolichyl-phosphate-mannose--protein O-mannosyl transferase
MTSLSIRAWLISLRDDLKRWVRTAWGEQSTVERLVTVFLGVMIVGGLIIRVQGVAAPTSFTFDEEPFVKNAHNYALGLADTNDHPPLGKLLIGVGLTLFGFNSLGWRFIPLCFGLQTVILAYWLGRALFRDKRAGWMAAAFIAADGFFISYSRSGLLDGTMLTLILWSVVAAVCAQTWRGVLVSAILIGLATTVKWSGIFAGVPAAAAILVMRRVDRRMVLLLGFAPLVHFLAWTGALALTGQPNDYQATWKVMKDLYLHHLDLGHYKNELSSWWWGWPILKKPIVIKLSDEGALKRYSSSVGNLVFWAIVTISALSLPLVTLYVLARTKLKRFWLEVLGPDVTKAMLVMLLGWYSFILPWVATSSTRGKYTFSHYYLPCYMFGLVGLAGVVAYLERRRPRVIAYLIGFALAVSIFYAPVWGEFPMTTAAANHRLFIVSWRP